MVMGAWFLATAFSNYLAALIAKFTGVEHGEEEGLLPPPTETVETYANVFGPIAVAAIVSAVVVLIISPLLTKWMHQDVDSDSEVNDLDQAHDIAVQNRPIDGD